LSRQRNNVAAYVIRSYDFTTVVIGADYNIKREGAKMKKKEPVIKRESSQFKMIRISGGSRIIAIGKFLPEDWRMVKVSYSVEQPLNTTGSETVDLHFERVA